jgi:SulP family sulfate permease
MLVNGLRFDNLRGDIYGGIVAAVVALPLALAFGVASGAGAIAGLYGAIFVGFFAALFGGTPAQCSGPTGPMTVVMAGIVVQFSDQPALAFTTVILAGICQILFGVCRIGQYISLIPYPVISGFMSAIGAIIIILQIGPALGHQGLKGVLTNLSAIPDFVSDPVFDALLVFLLTISIVCLTPGRISKIIPASLLALIVGTLVVANVLTDAPVIGDIPQGFPEIIRPIFDVDILMLMLESAVVLAMLGSIDSLLTSLVCDNMTRSHHDSNRELIGQGIGNIVAGFLGGLPGAGATMRSVANIRTGGRTPISGMLHSVILLAILLGLGPLAEKIPLAVLAGILFKVGVDIIDWRFLKRLRGVPRADLVVMASVFLITVLVDLITGVAVGVVLASLLFVKEMSELELANFRIIVGGIHEAPLDSEESEILERNKERILLIHIEGPMSFGSAKTMVRRVMADHAFNTVKSVVFDLSDVPIIDGTACTAVDDILAMVHANGQHLIFVAMQPKVSSVLENFGVKAHIRPGHQFETRLTALKHAAYVAGSKHSDDVSGYKI